MITNQATTKMIKNLIDGATPLSMKGYLNSIPVGGIVMFDRFVNVPEIAAGSWEQMKGAFPFFAGGGALIGIGESGGEVTTSHFHNSGNLYARVIPHENDGLCIEYVIPVDQWESGILMQFAGRNDGMKFQLDAGTRISGKTGTETVNNMPPYIGVCAWRRIE